MKKMQVMPPQPVAAAEPGPKHVRELQIFDYVKAKGSFCTNEELVKQFDVSPVTIHRDLTALAGQGLVRKLTGGVELVARPAAAAEHHFAARILRRSAEKAQIAAKALPLVREGDVVFLDSSTTALHLARRIQQSPPGELTLITNSILIIQEFHLFPPQCQLLAVAGRYRPQLHALLGRASLQSLGGLRPRQLFLSAATVHPVAGMQSFHEDHAEFLAALVERCERRVLLADSAKFGRESLFRIAGLEAVQTVVSDDAIAPAMAAACRAAGAEVL